MCCSLQLEDWKYTSVFDASTNVWNGLQIEQSFYDPQLTKVAYYCKLNVLFVATDYYCKLNVLFVATIGNTLQFLMLPQMFETDNTNRAKFLQFTAN